MRASARELLVPFFTPLVWCVRDSNPRPLALKADALPIELSGRLKKNKFLIRLLTKEQADLGQFCLHMQAFKWAYFSCYSYFSLLFGLAPTFPYFFLKMPYYPYPCTLKCHLRVKIQKIILARYIRSNFIYSQSTFLREHAAKHFNFLLSNPKKSLFSWYYCTMYYPAHKV